MYHEHRLLLELRQNEVERKAKHSWKWFQRGTVESEISQKEIGKPKNIHQPTYTTKPSKQICNVGPTLSPYVCTK